MRETAVFLNELQETGVVRNYALAGDITVMRYTEPLVAFEAKVLVDLPDSKRSDALQRIFEHCARLGLNPEGGAICAGAWPVRFVLALSDLAHEAIEAADVADYEGIPLRVVRAAHLVALALSDGRSKDMSRILALLDARAVTRRNPLRAGVARLPVRPDGGVDDVPEEVPR